MNATATQQTPEQRLREVYDNTHARIIADLERLDAIREEDGDPFEEFGDVLLELKFGAVWQAGETDRQPSRFWALIGTGGPAMRIVGEINQYGEPEDCRLEVQDWFQPWTDFETAAQVDLDAWAQDVAGVYWCE